MGSRKEFQKRASQSVIAVQLDLETLGFTYQKWGGAQTCKPGDWLVSNRGDTYTIDREVFERTYRQVSPGVFVKSTSVWAEVAEKAGKIDTKEGVTHYRRGDYIVFNNQDGTDGYAVSKKAFEEMYELVE